MTNGELMQLMTDMGLFEGGMENWVPDNAWLRVANRVIEIEREACAKVCEEYQDAVDRHKWPNGYQCAAAIRARGNTP